MGGSVWLVGPMLSLCIMNYPVQPSCVDFAITGTLGYQPYKQGLSRHAYILNWLHIQVTLYSRNTEKQASQERRSG